MQAIKYRKERFGDALQPLSSILIRSWLATNLSKVCEMQLRQLARRCGGTAVQTPSTTYRRSHGPVDLYVH